LVKTFKNRSIIKNKTIIGFDTSFYDFGTIEKNKPVAKYFVYTNVGEKPLQINNVSSTCGCTITSLSDKIILPRKKDSILVKYDAKKIGKFSKTVFIYYNSNKSNPFQLKIKGFVKD